MSRPLLAAISATAILSACSPVTQYNGFQALDVQPAQIKAGEDTRTTVMSKLGSPSTVSTFDKNVWYYISATTEKYAYYKPRAVKRDVTAIRFTPDEKVAEVKTLTLQDGYQLAYGKRETPTRGRELSILEQILGNVGRGGILPQENDPGNPRGNR